MDDDDHRELARVLNRIQGRAAISGYDCELMNELYPPPRWRKIVGPTVAVGIGAWGTDAKCRRVTECLWTNYDPVTDVAPLWGQKEVQNG